MERKLLRYALYNSILEAAETSSQIYERFFADDQDTLQHCREQFAVLEPWVNRVKQILNRFGGHITPNLNHTIKSIILAAVRGQEGM